MPKTGKKKHPQKNIPPIYICIYIYIYIIQYYTYNHIYICGVVQNYVPENCPYAALCAPFAPFRAPAESGHGNMIGLSFIYRFINSGIQTFREPPSPFRGLSPLQQNIHIHIRRCHSDLKALHDFRTTPHNVYYIYIIIYMHQSALGTGLILVVNFTPQHGGGAWDGLYGRKGTVYQQQPLLDFIIVTTRALTTTTPPQPAQLSPFTQPRIQSLHQRKSNNLRPKQEQNYTHNEPKSMPGARSEPQSASDSAKYIALHHIALKGIEYIPVDVCVT